MIPAHLGPLHPVEQALTLLLAFGPFVLLAIVVVLRRRQNAQAENSDPGQVKTGTTESPRSSSS